MGSGRRRGAGGLDARDVGCCSTGSCGEEEMRRCCTRERARATGVGHRSPSGRHPPAPIAVVGPQCRRCPLSIPSPPPCFASQPAVVGPMERCYARSAVLTPAPAVSKPPSGDPGAGGCGRRVRRVDGRWKGSGGVESVATVQGVGRGPLLRRWPVQRSPSASRSRAPLRNSGAEPRRDEREPLSLRANARRTLQRKYSEAHNNWNQCAGAAKLVERPGGTTPHENR